MSAHLAAPRSSTAQAAQQATTQANTIGLTGSIALLVVLFLASLAGGYVAGRMARFDGLRQGIAVWVIGLLVAVSTDDTSEEVTTQPTIPALSA